MMNFNKFKEEYDLRKIAAAGFLFIGISLVVFSGLSAVNNRIDIRNRAQTSCTPLEEKSVTCSFDIQSSEPFYYQVTIVSNGDDIPGPIEVTGPEQGEHQPGDPIPPETLLVPYSNHFICKVHAWVVNSCGRNDAYLQEEIACYPLTEPTPTNTPPVGGDTPTPTPTPGGGGRTMGICKECSRIDVSLDYSDPGNPQPTLTPPNQSEADLKIGRLKLRWNGPTPPEPTPDACSGAKFCADIEKIEFVAFNGPSCNLGQVGVTTIMPTPPNQENRYGTAISCNEATSETGALFRLHQASGAQCRCYQVQIKFNFDPDDPDAPLYCPNLPQEQICCPTTCRAPEIIDDPDDPNDGCPGDPHGSLPTSTPKCYFNPQNSCPSINQNNLFRTWSAGSSSNTIEFDDDFEQSEFSVPGGDNQEITYRYNDGGSYDVKMTCNEGGSTYTCKKRLTVACDGGGGGSPPPPTPAPSNTPIPACLLPDVSGTCVDQP